MLCVFAQYYGEKRSTYGNVMKWRLTKYICSKVIEICSVVDKYFFFLVVPRKPYCHLYLSLQETDNYKLMASAKSCASKEVLNAVSTGTLNLRYNLISHFYNNSAYYEYVQDVGIKIPLPTET